MYHFEGPKTEVEISSRNDKAVFTLEMVDAALKTSFDWAASYDLWLTDIRISGKANAKLLDLDMTKSVALGGFEFKLFEAQLVLKRVTVSSGIFEKSKNVRYFLEEGTYFLLL